MRQQESHCSLIGVFHHSDICGWVTRVSNMKVEGHFKGWHLVGNKKEHWIRSPFCNFQIYWHQMPLLFYISLYACYRMNGWNQKRVTCWAAQVVKVRTIHITLLSCTSSKSEDEDNLPNAYVLVLTSKVGDSLELVHSVEECCKDGNWKFMYAVYAFWSKV